MYAQDLIRKFNFGMRRVLFIGMKYSPVTRLFKKSFKSYIHIGILYIYINVYIYTDGILQML